MIRIANAMSISRVLTSGRSRPIVAVARTLDGKLIQCVCKVTNMLSGGDYGTTNLVSEVLGSVIAKEVGVEVQEPFFVTGLEKLARLQDPELRDRLTSATDPTFGSLLLDGAVMWNPITSDARREALQSLRIMLLDFMIGNSDRRPDNANLFQKEGQLIAIDHDLALADLNTTIIGGTLKPWEPAGADWIFRDGAHALIESARKAKAEYEAICEPWRELEFELIVETISQMPDSWKTENKKIDTVTSYFEELVDKIDDCLSEFEVALG